METQSKINVSDSIAAPGANGLSKVLIESNEPKLNEMFTLYYLKGNNHQTAHMNFPFKGNFREAIQRGRNYCAQMNLRFISVRPFITDLDEEEKRQKLMEQE